MDKLKVGQSFDLVKNIEIVDDKSTISFTIQHYNPIEVKSTEYDMLFYCDEVKDYVSHGKTILQPIGKLTITKVK